MTAVWRQIAAVADDHTPAGDLETLVREHIALDDAVRALRAARDRTNTAIVAAMPSRQVMLEGVAVVERRNGTVRKRWDTDLLVAQVAQRAADKPEADADGVVIPEGVRVARAIAAAARLEWRSSVLKQLGLDPDRYCDVEHGPPSAVIHPAPSLLDGEAAA